LGRYFRGGGIGIGSLFFVFIRHDDGMEYIVSGIEEKMSLDISGVHLGSLSPYRNKMMKAGIYLGPYDCPYTRCASAGQEKAEILRQTVIRNLSKNRKQGYESCLLP
jgi:hypothetical protein